MALMIETRIIDSFKSQVKLRCAVSSFVNSAVAGSKHDSTHQAEVPEVGAGQGVFGGRLRQRARRREEHFERPRYPPANGPRHRGDAIPIDAGIPRPEATA